MATTPQAPEFPNALRQRLFFLHIGYIVTGCVGVISSWAAFGWPILLSFLALVMGVIGCVLLSSETNLTRNRRCTARGFARLSMIVAAGIACFGCIFAVCGVVSLVWGSVSGWGLVALRVFAALAVFAAAGMVGCAFAVFVWARDLEAQLERVASAVREIREAEAEHAKQDLLEWLLLRDKPQASHRPVTCHTVTSTQHSSTITP